MTRSTLFGIRLPVAWIRQTTTRNFTELLDHFTHQDGREA